MTWSISLFHSLEIVGKILLYAIGFMLHWYVLFNSEIVRALPSFVKRSLTLRMPALLYIKFTGEYLQSISWCVKPISFSASILHLPFLLSRMRFMVISFWALTISANLGIFEPPLRMSFIMVLSLIFDGLPFKTNHETLVINFYNIIQYNDLECIMLQW